VISPEVGIHHHGVEQLRAEMLELPRPKEWSHTIRANVGYIIDGK
jgi:hypothetical protein